MNKTKKLLLLLTGLFSLIGLIYFLYDLLLVIKKIMITMLWIGMEMEKHL